MSFDINNGVSHEQFGDGIVVCGWGDGMVMVKFDDGIIRNVIKDYIRSQGMLVCPTCDGEGEVGYF